MGANLRRLVKEYKGKKLEDGKSFSGKGRLINARINAIQNFYGRAISNNKGNTEKMSKEIWAVLYHYASTADKPCIQTAQQVIKVGVATKRMLLMEHLHINPLSIHYLRL